MAGVVLARGLNPAGAAPTVRGCRAAWRNAPDPVAEELSRGADGVKRPFATRERRQRRTADMVEAAATCASAAVSAASDAWQRANCG